MDDKSTVGLTGLLTSLQQGVAGLNNLARLLNGAVVNSSSLLVTGVSTTVGSTTVGTVTSIGTGVGLTGGPITSSGTIAVSLAVLANSLSSNVALTNVSSYFTGPTVSQGTSGVFFASGTVTVQDTAGAAGFDAKLWDGTTVIASADINTPGATFGAISLSGVITNPTSDIRMSVKDLTAVTGLIIANRTGNSKDSTLTVMRIG